MAQMDDRMQLIGSAILSQARQEARELIDKANAIRKEEIAKCEDEIVNSMFSKVQNKANALRLDTVKSIARAELEAHRAILTHRQGQNASVFEAVTKRLMEYRKTRQYKDDVLDKIKAVKDGCDHSYSIVYLSADDMDLSGLIKGALGENVRIETDASIKIGGFKLKNEKARTLIDETLDERLNNQRLWFLQNCGLKIM